MFNLKLIYSSSKSSPSDLSEKSSLRFVSYFNTRIFHELPKSFYLSDAADPQEDQAYINEFILNPKWLLNKSFTCSSVLYYLHDLVSYRKLFMSADENISDDLASISPTTTPTDTTWMSPISLDELSSMSTKKKYARFERVIYKILFNLSQDQNQFGYYVHALGMEPLLTNPAYLTTKISSSVHLTPVNYEFFKIKENVDAKLSISDSQEATRELVHFTKVVFVQRGVFLTLSDAPYNCIKVNTQSFLFQLVKKSFGLERDFGLLSLFCSVCEFR